jgi:tellurite resistance protein TerC
MPFINDGEQVSVVEISTMTFLGVIIGILSITVIASLICPAGHQVPRRG